MSHQSHLAHTHSHHAFSRREFLKTMGVVAAGALAASCRPEVVDSRPTVATASPTVAIAQAANYDPKLIRQQVQSALDKIGGIADVLKHGNRAAIKINVTGSKQMQQVDKLPEIETYHTHPEVVRAVGQLLRDAGITKLYIVEAVYAKEHWHDYGWDEVAKSLGATLLCRAPRTSTISSRLTTCSAILTLSSQFPR
jgi:hypothetical protein